MATETKNKPTRKAKKRVAMTFTQTQHRYLERLAERHQKTPTTFCYDLVCNRIVKAIENDEIPSDESSEIVELNALKAFMIAIIKETDVDDDLLESVATSVGSSKEQLTDVFFWEPETDQDL